jgi:hypothetical protein
MSYSFNGGGGDYKTTQKDHRNFALHTVQKSKIIAQGCKKFSVCSAHYFVLKSYSIKNTLIHLSQQFAQYFFLHDNCRFLSVVLRK